ncbi:hypothetical protein BCR42DRAFT_337114 [Absidia repens]|uniref:Uncharacterized protein n=1 Tax=Absidia repens TaxID=90262 RepID=A0A1X2HZY6_9FUNG|nr:hypothetical protein BCR42DRAFT_337114 [Absidia repens]
MNEIRSELCIILIYRKEKSSRANSSTINNKRRLSGLDPITNAKMGRKMDTVYLSGGYELGYLEIGAGNDQTKHFRDGLVKLWAVMRDSMLELANRLPDIADDIHVLGYDVTGKSFLPSK